MNEIKNKYLQKITLESYNEYLEAVSEGIVEFEQILDNKGFTYVKKLEKGYGIRVSYEDIPLYEVLEVLDKYLQSDRQVIYLLVNSDNKEFLEYAKTLGFEMMYPALSMVLHRNDFEPYDLNIALKPFTIDDKEDYLNLLGPAFFSIRKKLNLEPYNWHQNNVEEAVNGFIESSKNKTLNGYYVNNELVGVLEVINNDLEMIAVKTTEQGKGYGKLLLRKSINMVFENKKHNYMSLSLLDGNDGAYKLYSNEGFKIVSKQSIMKKEKDSEKS